MYFKSDQRNLCNSGTSSDSRFVLMGKEGRRGLQTVVPYPLPELDGAIHTVIIGGLVGENIYLVPGKLNRLKSRLKKSVSLCRKANKEKLLAIVISGFPPASAVTGTAALLNVPLSLRNILQRLDAENFDIGHARGLAGEDILQMVKSSDTV